MCMTAIKFLMQQTIRSAIFFKRTSLNVQESSSYLYIVQKYINGLSASAYSLIILSIKSKNIKNNYLT